MSIGTWAFLEKNAHEYINEDTYTRKDLSLAAQLPFDEVCRLVQESIPSTDWMIANISGSAQLDDSNKSLIRSYMSYGFDSINESLRKGWSRPVLNEKINMLPPIDSDIYVLRRIRKGTVNLPESEAFQSLGYVSTSINFALYLKQKDLDGFSYLRIRVPAGSKALYIPGHEKELLLEHGVVLQVLAHYQKPVQVKGQIYNLDWYDLLLE